MNRTHIDLIRTLLTDDPTHLASEVVHLLAGNTSLNHDDYLLVVRKAKSEPGPATRLRIVASLASAMLEIGYKDAAPLAIAAYKELTPSQQSTADIAVDVGVIEAKDCEYL